MKIRVQIRILSDQNETMNNIEQKIYTFGRKKRIRTTSKLSVLEIRSTEH